MCFSFKPSFQCVMMMLPTFFFYVYVFILHQAAKIVKKVYSVLPDYDKIVSALLKDGVWELPMKCDFTLGVPVGPMLSKATKSVSEILNKFQGVEFTCEYKYDGERAQVVFHSHIFHQNALLMILIMCNNISCIETDTFLGEWRSRDLQ